MITWLILLLCIAAIVYAIYSVSKFEGKEFCEECGEYKHINEMFETNCDAFVSEYTCEECVNEQADKKQNK